MSEKKKKLKLKAPNAMLILVIIVLASAIASYVVPAGLYDRVADPATGRAEGYLELWMRQERFMWEWRT